MNRPTPLAPRAWRGPARLDRGVMSEAETKQREEAGAKEGCAVDLFGAPLVPEPDNKFHAGNGEDGKHYWLTPPALYAALDAEFGFDLDVCPYPKPADFDGLTDDWGRSNFANLPFGSIIHDGKKKGATAWARKALAEAGKGNTTVILYPIDKWVLMLLQAGAEIRNLGDVKWLAIEDGSEGKGTGRHIAAFIVRPPAGAFPVEEP